MWVDIFYIKLTKRVIHYIIFISVGESFYSSPFVFNDNIILLNIIPMLKIKILYSKNDIDLTPQLIYNIW